MFLFLTCTNVKISQSVVYYVFIVPLVDLEPKQNTLKPWSLKHWTLRSLRAACPSMEVLTELDDAQVTSVQSTSTWLCPFKKFIALWYGVCCFQIQANKVIQTLTTCLHVRVCILIHLWGGTDLLKVFKKIMFFSSHQWTEHKYDKEVCVLIWSDTSACCHKRLDLWHNAIVGNNSRP